jgi:hypothetical protein
LNVFGFETRSIQLKVIHINRRLAFADFVAVLNICVISEGLIDLLS